MEEVWKDIPRYEGYYQVSNLGRVRSLDRCIPNSSLPSNVQHLTGKVLSQADNGAGYLFVALCKQQKYKQRTVHSLVAEAFIPNPENKQTVNHKDGNKKNNIVSNLEWATQSENCKHANSMGLRIWTEESRRRVGKASKLREGKSVICVTTNKMFSSMSDAAREYGLDVSSISNSIYEDRTTKGLKFKLADSLSASKPIKKKLDGRTIKVPILCITTGVQYKSISEAARETNMNSSTVSDSIRLNRPVKGLLFKKISSDKR